MSPENAFLKLFGRRMREARERVGLTQEELAIRIGRAQNLISRYERGRQGIHISELPILAQALSVPIAYFFGESTASEEISAILERLTPPMQQAAKETLIDYMNLQNFLTKAVQDAIAHGEASVDFIEPAKDIRGQATVEFLKYILPEIRLSVAGIAELPSEDRPSKGN